MRKIKEILRLHHEHKLGQRQIAQAAGVSQSTVHEYLARAKAAGLNWPLNEEWDEQRLFATLFPPNTKAATLVGQKASLDFAYIRRQLEQHRDLTKELLWEEYRQQNPDGYCYSRFCRLYRDWKQQQEVVLRQEHKPGEKLYVDWAGATIAIHHADGSLTQAPLFVSALGVSSYTYAEVTANQQMENWLKVQMHAFEFYGGVTQLVIPDNTKTGVTKACRYEPDLNPTYQEFAAHYQVAVLPTRPRKPRDKAKVESAVQVVQRWIVMRLRHRKFFSVTEANQAVQELLAYLNHRPFRKRREECRASLFEKVDRPALRPLPAQRYDLSQWATARVNIDYHVAHDGNWYSVPYLLTGQQVDVRTTSAIVEILHKGKRVASHLRHRGRNEAITQPEHRPKSHQAYLEWTPSRIIDWAAKTGPQTAQLVERILASKPHPESGYRSCLGLIRLANKYSAARMEAAAERALLGGAIGYPHVKSILEKCLDAQPLCQPPERPPSPSHDNLRGPEYFQ
jgi:transposase